MLGGPMLRPLVTLGLTLFALPVVAAQDISPSSSPAVPGHASAFQAQMSTDVGGGATQEAKRDDQLKRLLKQKCAERDHLQREIMQLRAATGTPRQILVKVQMIEVSLTKMHRMGLDTARFTGGSLDGPKR